MKTQISSLRSVIAAVAVCFTLAPAPLNSAQLAESDTLAVVQPSAIVAQPPVGVDSAAPEHIISRIPEAGVSRIALNFAEALRSENPGVRESALYHGFLFKLMFPDVPMHEMNRALKDLSVHEAHPELRYRAHLAWYFFESGEYHLLLPLDKIPKEEELFRRAQEVVRDRMYSAQF